MRFVIILLFSLFIAFAKDVDLHAILKAVKQSHPLMQIVKKEQKLQHIKNQLTTANDPIEAQVAGAHAKNNDDTSGNELYISLSQELLMPKTKSALKKSAHSFTRASALLAQQKVAKLLNSITATYYNACLDKEIYRLQKENLANLEKFAHKMHKAYKLGEISHKDLLALQTEIVRAKAQVQQASSNAQSSLLQLKALLSTTDLAFDDIVCQDFALQADIDSQKLLQNSPIIGAKRAKIKALKHLLTRYSSTIDRYSINVEYSDEYGTKRYTAGIGIPLYFSSTKRELQKKEILEQISLLQTSLQHEIATIKSTLTRLTQKLQTLQKSYEATKKIEKEQRKLHSLIQKSYLSGESSFVELMQIKRDLIATQIEAIQYKKEYIQTLTQIYTSAGIKEKE